MRNGRWVKSHMEKEFRAILKANFLLSLFLIEKNLALAYQFPK
jgi:hypothetical protein